MDLKYKEIQFLAILFFNSQLTLFLGQQFSWSSFLGDITITAFRCQQKYYNFNQQPLKGYAKSNKCKEMTFQQKEPLSLMPLGQSVSMSQNGGNQLFSISSTQIPNGTFWNASTTVFMTCKFTANFSKYIK